MRSLRHPSLGFALATALTSVALIFAFSPPSFAEEADSGGTTCTCPDARGKSTRPKFADLHRPLDESDEIAALTSVQVALSRVGDGMTFRWRRSSGLLSGIVSPTSSFRNANGTICRHFVILLTTGFKTKKTEGIACRMADGRWQLEG